MERATPAPLSEIIQTPLGFWLAVYLALSLLAMGYIIFRGMKLGQGSGGLPWEKKDTARNGLYLLTQLLLRALAARAPLSVGV